MFIIITGKILIADDSMFMRMFLKKRLNELGIENIIEASNGPETIRKYHEEKPILTILDITMPEMSGLDVLTEIKESNPDANVIMCSAMGQQSIVIESIKRGALDFITKPFESARLTEVFTKLKYKLNI